LKGFLDCEGQMDRYKAEIMSWIYVYGQ